jgi:hypothetical protein
MKKILMLTIALSFVLFLSGCKDQKQDLYNNTVIPTPTTKNNTVVPTPLTAQTKSDAPVTPQVTNTNPVNSDAVVPTPATPPEKKPDVVTEESAAIISGYAFDKCDTRWQFKTEAWYPGLVEAITSTPALTTLEAARIIAIEGSEYSSAQDAIADYGNLSETNIAHICRTSGDEMALIMINGSTDITGGMARYDMASNTFEVATIDPYYPMHLYSFTARAGDVIPLRAGYREDECLSTFKVDYNFVTNQAVPVRQCKTCGAESEICTSLIG